MEWGSRRTCACSCACTLHVHVHAHAHAHAHVHVMYVQVGVWAWCVLGARLDEAGACVMLTRARLCGTQKQQRARQMHTRLPACCHPGRWQASKSHMLWMFAVERRVNKLIGVKPFRSRASGSAPCSSSAPTAATERAMPAATWSAVNPLRQSTALTSAPPAISTAIARDVQPSEQACRRPAQMCSARVASTFAPALSSSAISDKLSSVPAPTAVTSFWSSSVGSGSGFGYGAGSNTSSEATSSRGNSAPVICELSRNQ